MDTTEIRDDITPGPWVIDWQPIPGLITHPDFSDLHYVNIHSANYDDVAPHGLSITGYMRRPDVHVLAAAREMLEALKELLASELTLMPPFEAGKDAQDAWVDRRAKARNDAAFIIAKVERWS